MKRQAIIALHLTYWSIYLLLTFSSALLQGIVEEGSHSNDLAATWSFVLNSVICFYLFYFWLVPSILAKQRIKRFVILGLTIALISAILVTLGKIPFQQLNSTTFGATEYSTGAIAITWVFYLLLFTVLGLLSGLMATLMRGFISWYGEIRVKEAMAKKQIETELALLKAQLNPHFLFNTLNNIDVLIEKDSKSASIYLKKLSDILRFILYDTQSDKIELWQEVEHIKKYIDLQRIRTLNGEFVKIQLDLPEDGRTLLIAPMLFVPFIENAFKHCSNKKVAEAINIDIRAKGDEIQFHCKNLVSSREANSLKRGGLGLQLVRQRLNLLYNGSHTLEVITGNDSFEINLMLKVK